MEPDLEVVQIGKGESFKAWSHGYPFRTVRWHFHSEYEIHLVVATRGRYFVGDFIGEFEPGNLVLTGPNLPHNWVSDVPEATSVPLRCKIIQFSQEFIDGAITLLPELSALQRLLDDSTHGLLFSSGTARDVAPSMDELLTAKGIRRLELFLGVVRILADARNVKQLASASYMPDPSGYMSASMNKVLAFIRENLTGRFSEADLAAIAGQSPTTFSRAFKRHTGMSLVQYANRMRINLACQLLSDSDTPITDICFDVGFSNLSNFNRRFRAQKGMPPSRFRMLWGENTNVGVAA